MKNNETTNKPVANDTKPATPKPTNTKPDTKPKKKRSNGYGWLIFSVTIFMLIVIITTVAITSLLPKLPEVWAVAILAVVGGFAAGAFWMFLTLRNWRKIVRKNKHKGHKPATGNVSKKRSIMDVIADIEVGNDEVDMDSDVSSAAEPEGSPAE